MVSRMSMTPTKRGPAVGVMIAAAVAAVTPMTSAFEGTRLKPYRDPVGVETVCTGETQVAMHPYTVEQCADMLRKDLSQKYASAVIACTPDVATRINTFAAAIDAAYNAGPGAYCRSPMADHFRARQWQQGCEAFRGWHVYGLPGLARRRDAESSLCMKDLVK